MKALYTVCYLILYKSNEPTANASSLAISTTTHPHFEPTSTSSSSLSILPFAVSRSPHPTPTLRSRVLNPMLLLPLSSQIPRLAKPAAKAEPRHILPPFLCPLSLLRLLLLRPRVSPSLSIPGSEITVRSLLSVLKSNHSRRLIIRKRARHHQLAPPRPCCWHPVEPLYLPVWR